MVDPGVLIQRLGSAPVVRNNRRGQRSTGLRLLSCFVKGHGQHKTGSRSEHARCLASQRGNRSIELSLAELFQATGKQEVRIGSSIFGPINSEARSESAFALASASPAAGKSKHVRLVRSAM